MVERVRESKMDVSNGLEGALEGWTRGLGRGRKTQMDQWGWGGRELGDIGAGPGFSAPVKNCRDKSGIESWTGLWGFRSTGERT